MPVSIRTATEDDIPQILAIERTASQASHWTAEQYKTRIDSGWVVVAELDKRLAGFLCAAVVAGEWEIENVIVEESNRRSGIGLALIGAIFREWRQKGGTVFWLEVRESHVAARSLYEKLGFRETGRRRDYYRDPVEDAILYSRQREPLS